MNKSELIADISTKTGLSKKDTESVLNAFMKTIEETLKRGEKVQLVGFGTFEAKKKSARPGRNPRQPEIEILIPESIAPVFKAGKYLKESLNT
ncbi:MAG: HU family DNA-binding protein [Firmicutes bacterium]|nr:HU family DNA-binding protein [Bacillota bacterium]